MPVHHGMGLPLALFRSSILQCSDLSSAMRGNITQHQAQSPQVCSLPSALLKRPGIDELSFKYDGVIGSPLSWNPDSFDQEKHDGAAVESSSHSGRDPGLM